MVANSEQKIPIPKKSIFKDLEVVRIGGNLAVRYRGELFNSAERHAPVLAKILAAQPIEGRLSTEMFGASPPNVFVGEFGYPNVSIGPMLNANDALDPTELDSPSDWVGLDYGELISMRSSLVTGKKIHRVSGQSRYLSDLQDSIISLKPIDIEMKFEQKPAFSLYFSPQTQPSGPSATLRSLTVAENPRIPSIVDEVIAEKLLVREAVPELLSHNLDYYYVQKLLSAGVLGKERKIVPTKWSITGADDIIGKHLLESVRQFDQLGEFRIYSHEYLFNHFEVLLMPGNWEFENFESWAPSTPWAQGESAILQEHEPFWGRTGYAESQAGGYYASRLGVIEGLTRMRRQARAVVFREVGEGYVVPMGVWQVRENVRSAMQSTPVKCSSLKDALAVLSTRLRHPVSEYVKLSRVLAQKRMDAWL